MPKTLPYMHQKSLLLSSPFTSQGMPFAIRLQPKPPPNPPPLDSPPTLPAFTRPYHIQLSNDTSSVAPLQIRATLSWLDPPSSIYAARQLQHDLDLNVTSPAGVSYVMWQSSGLKDSANNNERVVVPAADAAEAGVWTVIVSANALTTESQDYSLVVTVGNVVTFSAEKGMDTSGAAGRLRVVTQCFWGAGLCSAVMAIVCSAFISAW